MKIYIPLLLLIILTLSFSSCSKKDDSTAATAAVPGVSDPNTDASWNSRTDNDDRKHRLYNINGI